MQASSVHFRILSICWAVYGVVCLATALLMILVRNNAATLAELLAYRVTDDPLRLLAIFNVAYTVIISLSVACGILGLVAAVTLPRRRPLGRKVALLAGFLSLSRIPLGITLGVYTLVVLLPADSLRSETALDVGAGH